MSIKPFTYDDGQLGLNWGRTLRHFIWPLILLPMGVLGLIGDLVVYFGYWPQMSMGNFFWDGIFIAVGGFGGWKLSRFLRVFRKADLSTWDRIPQAVEDLGWHIVFRNDDQYILQRRKRSHWHWSRERIVVFKMPDRVLIKSHRNVALTKGFFGSYEQSRKNELDLAKALKN